MFPIQYVPLVENTCMCPALADYNILCTRYGVHLEMRHITIPCFVLACLIKMVCKDAQLLVLIDLHLSRLLKLEKWQSVGMYLTL